MWRDIGTYVPEVSSSDCLMNIVLAVEASMLKCLCWREYGDEVEEGSH